MPSRASAMIAIGSAFALAFSPLSVAFGQAASETAALAPTDSEARTTPSAAATAAPEAEAPAPQTITAEQTNNARVRKVTLQLAGLRDEREHTSTLGPWLLTSVGIAALVVGLSAGVGRTLSCKQSCSGPFWPGWVVVGGATVTTAGAIWLVWKRGDIAELELRKSSLERELQNLEWNRAAKLEAAPRAALSFRARF